MNSSKKQQSQQSWEDYEIQPKKKVDKHKVLDQDILEELITLRDYDQIVSLAEKVSGCLKDYQRIKYQDKIYLKGDSLMFSVIKNNQKVDQIGKLKRIVSIKSFVDQQELPLIQVNWYCNKEDLGGQYKDMLLSFSNFELFLTELESTLFIDSIQYACQVVTYEEYEDKINKDDDKQTKDEDKIYFMRGAYNSQLEKLTPDLNEWPKQCICNTPPNPDLPYIQCEKCMKWMHMSCVNITEEEANNIELYVCPKCRTS